MEQEILTDRLDAFRDRLSKLRQIETYVNRLQSLASPKTRHP
jgi:hypothetical protein